MDYILILGDNAKDMVTFNEVLLDNGQQIFGPMKMKEEWISYTGEREKKRTAVRKRKTCSN